MRPLCARIIREFLARTFPTDCQHFLALFFLFSLFAIIFYTSSRSSVSLYLWKTHSWVCVYMEWSLIENLSVQRWGYGSLCKSIPFAVAREFPADSEESQSLPLLSLDSPGKLIHLPLWRQQHVYAHRGIHYKFTAGFVRGKKDAGKKLINSRGKMNIYL